jgi:HEAT repeat protein
MLRRCLFGLVCLLVSALGVRADDATNVAQELGKQLHGKDAVKTAERLAKMGKVAVPVLIEALKDKDNNLKSIVANALGQIGPDAKDAIPELAEGLKNQTEPYAISALTLALGKIGSASVPALRELLKGNNVTIQGEAAGALKLIGPDAADAVPELIDVVKKRKDATDIAGLQAIDALGKIGPKAKDAVPELTEALKDKTAHSPFRLRAAMALGNLGPSAKDAVPALVEALNAETAKYGPLRFHAATALGQIGPDAEKAVLPLLDLLNDKNAGPVRLLAVDALGKIGPGAKDAVQTLKDVAGGGDKALAAAANKALEKIQK